MFSRNGAVMTETLETVTKKKPEPTAEQAAAEELVRQAREQGLSLTGPDGLLKQLTKVVIETALDQEMTEHLGQAVLLSKRRWPYPVGRVTADDWARREDASSRR